MAKQDRKSLTRHFFMIITLWTLLSVILFLGVNYVLMQQAGKARLTQDLFGKQEQVSQLFASELKVLSGVTSTLDYSSLISGAVQQRNPQALAGYVPALFQKAKSHYPPLGAIEITDRSGFLMFYTDLQGNQNSGRPRSPALREALFTSKAQSKVDHIVSSGQFVLESAHPLKIGDEIVGYIRTEAYPKEFISQYAKILGVDLVLVSLREDISLDQQNKTTAPKVRRKAVASSLENWKSQLLTEMMDGDLREITFEGAHFVFHPISFKFDGMNIADSEILIVINQSNHPLLFSQQLIIFLSIGAAILLFLNLIIFGLIRKWLWKPLAHYSEVLKAMNRGNFDQLASVTPSPTGREFAVLEASIDQLSLRLKSIFKGVRATSGELNEQSAILKENSERLTDTIDQSANEVREITAAAKELQITIKEVPIRLLDVSKALTDAALDSRSSATSATAIRRFADALRKSFSEFGNDS